MSVPREYRVNLPSDMTCGGTMVEENLSRSRLVSFRNPAKRVTSFMLCLLATPLTLGLLDASCVASDALMAVVSPQQNAIPACAPGTDGQVQRLDPGMVIERELGGAQSHLYAIVVPTKQFLRVIVDQRGIDLAATICGPDGKQIARVDRPSGANGPEAISILADQTGTFILQVKSLEKLAPV